MHSFLSKPGCRGTEIDTKKTLKGRKEARLDCHAPCMWATFLATTSGPGAGTSHTRLDALASSSGQFMLAFVPCVRTTNIRLWAAAPDAYPTHRYALNATPSLSTAYMHGVL